MVAARQGGGDVSMNPRLRLAIDKAKAANMPADTVKKNIDKATGNLEGVNYEEIRYEGYGIGGAAIIVDCMTDNRVRTVAEVRHAFSKYGGNLGTEGSVAFQFKHCGQFVFAPGTSEDKVMEVALDAGAEDVITDDDGAIEVLTAPPDFEAVKNALEKRRPEARRGRGHDARREHHRAGRRGRAAHAEAARRHRGPRRRAGRLSQRAIESKHEGPRHRLRRPRARAGLEAGAVAEGADGVRGARQRRHRDSTRGCTTCRSPTSRRWPTSSQTEKIALTVVGPEAPLAAGVVDLFRARGLRIFGPTRPRRSSKARRPSPRTS